ncbi:hypothetical protein R5H30_06235 [Sulfitobacter sp. D35]|uniref:DUF6902 family protein n=1 Tax=Sulfitobacter sp. D35 TaxID=3083252 RepID=UPI00296F1E72|nr:hypothetical protein [Sulfitobacter sp. D35]MDW4497573.1 hypothetical protein [Sulfitobacter sp. D35]
MGNVVYIEPSRRIGLQGRLAALLQVFASHRKRRDDVFWLKENAELLNICANLGAPLDRIDLDPYARFYADLPQRLRFFPQYYRFLLSICLDLEDLGIGGSHGPEICRHVAALDLPGMEISDLQRAEAVRLLARGGVKQCDAHLDNRLRTFIARSDTFALPNRKAAYELTHIVFYLSDYGRCDPLLDDRAITALEFAGLLAFLDQNSDLLAEVCIALRYVGQAPSAIWEGWLAQGLNGFAVSRCGSGIADDDYHDYLVTGWWAQLAGRSGFRCAGRAGQNSFVRLDRKPGPLRRMSEVMYQLGAERRRDWHVMRPTIADALSQECYDILAGAERSSDRFGEFFEGFARA